MENYCLIIPIYRHVEQFAKFIKKLPDIPIFLVDDGNSIEDKKKIKALAEQNNMKLISLPRNQGKNAAVFAGFRAALEHGYTHALQIDADGQHNNEDIERFISISKENSFAIINGCPVYDDSVPKSRLYGRKITNFWVMIETGGKHIKDAMCGFRVYPLKEVKPLLDSGITFKRMGGDIEIIVKAFWLGIKIINVDTNVTYPKDGFSNFNTLKDNIKISAMHTMLVTEKILRMMKWKK